MADIQPAFSIFHGDKLLNRALSPAETKHQESVGLSYAAQIYYPVEDEIYDCPTDLATHLVKQATADGVSTSRPARSSPPMQERHGGSAIPSASSTGAFCGSGRRSFRWTVNTYYPPNQPSPRRCFEFGRALGRAIAAWPGGQRIAVAASGGMTHFVVDEEMDARLLDAMATRNYEKLVSEPDIHFRSGTSEIKNWIRGCGNRRGNEPVDERS